MLTVVEDADDADKEIGVVFLRGCRCRCGHEWLPRDKTEHPRVCPKCKSPNWDLPRKALAKKQPHPV